MILQDGQTKSNKRHEQKIGGVVNYDQVDPDTGSAIRTSLLARINPKNQQRRYIIYHLYIRFLGLMEVIMGYHPETDAYSFIFIPHFRKDFLKALISHGGVAVFCGLIWYCGKFLMDMLAYQKVS